MSDFHDNASAWRFEQVFKDSSGHDRLVFADYEDQSGVRAILHVEADPVLRGTGVSGQFMQNLADYARGQGMRLLPLCGYARAWFRRHPDQGDVLSDGPD
jgi:Predicted acetyltransferase